MKKILKTKPIILTGIICGLLLLTSFFAGCTSSPVAQPVSPIVSTTAVPATASPTPLPSPVAISSTAAPVVLATTSTPVPAYTSSEGNVVAFTAASLKGVTPKLGSDFEQMYPSHKVVFNLDGTQALRTQVMNGAYTDVFISASNAYTTELTKGGYFVDETVQPLTSNYVIVILPANNPGNIKSLADLAKPGVKIAMADKSVPVGTATIAAIGNLAKSSYNLDWNTTVMKNVVTYETAEPGVATKVALGEVDAGFVYESTYTAAPKGTYIAIAIPKTDNYLQTYTIGVMKQSTSKGATADFETFMLSAAGQQALRDYGFRPI